MKVTYSEKTKQPAASYSLLQQATGKLEEVVGRHSVTANADWDLTEDAKGRPLYTLRVSDGSDSAKTSFAPDELTPSYFLQIRLYRLWGELLQSRTERQLQALTTDEE
jgi:hypothetical protein